MAGSGAQAEEAGREAAPPLSEATALRPYCVSDLLTCLELPEHATNLVGAATRCPT